ncbi:MAG: hypothetical protein PHS59_03480 [Paludibacter sp.]|nr:hypothetical protein [Paludibacter sp.]
MKYSILNLEELKAMGARDRKIVKDNYEIKAVAPQMVEFYQKLK